MVFSSRDTFDKGYFAICTLAFVALYSNVLKLWLGSWATLIYDIVLVCMLFFLVNYRWNPKHLPVLAAVFISVLLLVVLGMFEMLNPNISNHLYSLIEFRKTLFQLLTIFVAYAYCNDAGDGTTNRRIIRFVVIASVPLVVYGIKQFFLFDSLDAKLYSMMDSAADTNKYGSTARAISFFSGPFHYGMFCVLNMALAIFLARKVASKKYYVIAAICLVGVFCSYTRTNMACALITVTFFFAVSSAKVGNLNRVSTVRIVLSCLGLALVIAIFIGSPGYVNLGNDQLNSLINSILNAGQDTRLLNRFETWDQAFKFIDMHPITGNGIGAAGDTLAAHNVALNWVTPHNAFIKVAVELGIGGVALFTIFLVSSFVLSFRLAKTDAETLALLLSVSAIVLLNMMLGSTLGTFPVMSLIYLLFGLVCKRTEVLSCKSNKDKGRWRGDMLGSAWPYGNKSENLHLNL